MDIDCYLPLQFMYLKEWVHGLPFFSSLGELVLKLILQHQAISL